MSGLLISDNKIAADHEDSNPRGRDDLAMDVNAHSVDIEKEAGDLVW